MLQPSVNDRRFSLGLALGSGAAGGLAHIGVLKVLEEAKIAVHLVTGTSIGAFIGALYAAGVPVAQMEAAAREIDWRHMARLIDPVLPTSGLIDGKKLVEFMCDLLPVRTFEQLNLPLAITATDIQSGEAIIIKQGDLLEALRASLAFPGIFSPVRFGKRHLVDGGLCNPVPVDIARALGAKHIVGVCTIPKVAKHAPETFLPMNSTGTLPDKSWRDLFSAHTIERAIRQFLRDRPIVSGVDEFEEKMPNIFKICAQSVAIMENEINDLRLRLNEHDLLLRPALDDITLLEFHRAEEIITAGEAAAREKMPELRSLAEKD